MRKEERYKGVLNWFNEHVPVAETELHYDNPYQLLIAVILSAQCTDKRLNNDPQKKRPQYPIYWVCNRFITLQLSKMGFYHFTSDMSLFTISSAVYSSISVFVTCLICFFFRCRYTNSRKIV